MERVPTPGSSQVEDLLFIETEVGGIVYVWFRSGAVYRYTVSKEEWEAFKAAPSKGTFVQGLTHYTQVRGKGR